MRRSLFGSLFTVALLVGCAGSSAAPPAPAAPSSEAGLSGGDQTVNIKDTAFNPTSTSVKVGQKVTWTNADGVAHTATADDKSFDSGNLSSGATFAQEFTRPGRYAYHCSIHSSMKGTIVVT
jgi:plastocyanin